MTEDNPFDLDNPAAYEAWRARKLETCPTRAEDLIVEVDDPRRLSRAEYDAIMDLCSRSNMAVYAGNTGTDPDKTIPAALAGRFGLAQPDRNMGADDDGITALRVVDEQWRNRYIPYSDRPIHWHTDGYYNEPDRQIRALLLHCVRPAARGGENALLDHEIAYIRLRDLDPSYIEALMAPDAMTIPANFVNGTRIRPARSGPVFSLGRDGRLHMRYTARKHSIEWRKDPVTGAAVKALETLLASDDPFIHRLTLQPGWGLVSNNVLHNRSGFTDEGQQTRLLYRLRYYEPVGGHSTEARAAGASRSSG